MTYEYKVSHRDDGSVVWEQFYKEGLRHREGDRPAVVSYRADDSVEWESFWKEGQMYTPSKAKPWSVRPWRLTASSMSFDACGLSANSARKR